MADTTATPEDVVTRFCAGWGTLAISDLVAFFADDAVYHNIPMDPITGRDGIEATITGFSAGVESVTFEVLHQAVAGSVVLNERIDRFRYASGHELSIPVMGTFEVVDGLIVAWRDYFDLQMFMSQMPQS